MSSQLETEFDHYAADYAAEHARSIALSGEPPDYFARYKINDLKHICALQEIETNRILDFGTGTGNALDPLQNTFPNAHISGIDVSSRALEFGRVIARGRTDLHCYDGRHIPFPDGTFDIVFTACVFHHITADQHIALLVEIRRVLRPGGRFMLYEHNPLNPLTRHAVNNCRFDKNAVLITASEMRSRFLAAGFGSACIHFRVFFPRLLGMLRPLERSLAWLPLGAQYMLIGTP